MGMKTKILDFKPYALKVGVMSPFTDLEMDNGNWMRDRVVNVEEIFARVPLLNRAFRLRVDGLQRVPVEFYDLSDKKIDSWPFEETTPFTDWLQYAEGASLLRGASFTLELKDESGNPTGQLQLLNPFTVYVERQPRIIDGEKVLATAFWQQLPQGRFPKNKLGYWFEDDIWYLKGYNPSDDIGPGLSEASVAMRSAQVKHYMMAFFANFFERGAMPTVILGLSGDPDPGEKEKVENLFGRMTAGIRKVMRVVALSGEIKAEVLSPKIKDLDLENLRQDAILDISAAFGVPKTLLTSDSANYATALTEYRTFASYTLSGRCNFYERKLNPILAQWGVKVKFNIQALPEMQEDESNRSMAFKNYVESGLSQQLVAVILGVDIPDEKLKKEFFSAPDQSKTRDPGTVALPREDVAPPGNDKNEPRQAPIGGTNLPAQKADRELKADLQRWERKVLKRISEGKKASVEFSSDKISPQIQAGILTLLAEAKTDAEVKHIFSETVNESCPGVADEPEPASNRSDGQVLRSIESLALRMGELTEKVKPQITITPPVVNVRPQIDVAEIKDSMSRIMITELNSLIDTASRETAEGIVAWKSEFDLLRKQFENRVSELTGTQKAAVQGLFVKTAEDLEAVADRIIDTQTVLSAEEKRALKASEDKNINTLDRLSEKLEAILEAVSRPKTTTVERDNYGNIVKLKQE